MQPPEAVNPPPGDVVPYPGSALELGDGKWLTMTGRVVSRHRGRRCTLTAKTLAYWEATSLRGQGRPLSELIT